MMPNVINKFLDSTLHKVLPGLVSAQSTPLPLIHGSTETRAGKCILSQVPTLID